MYYVCKPTKIQIYINTGMKSTAQIKKELGCDIIINGGLYDMTWYRPYCWLRVDGTTLHSEVWSDWGYGWNADRLMMDTSDNVKLYRNFISCVALIRNGKLIQPLTYDPALGGKRGRTALGVMSDGSVLAYCTQDGTSWTSTPENLQRELMNMGCVSALMLDGGQSSRCIMPNGTVPDNRNRPYVQNFICIWTKPVTEKPSNTACPYTEPTHNIRWGSIGTGAKWVQWQLNRHGASLDVDGLFFGKSVEALKKFQHDNGLAWDGVCGPLTREELKK